MLKISFWLAWQILIYGFAIENTLSHGQASLSKHFYGYRFLHLCYARAISSMFICWMLDVSRTASYEITLVILLSCLSVCPSLNFLKIV